MRHLVLIPALGCDDRLYAPQADPLRRIFNVSSHIAKADRYPTTIDELLRQAPAEFIVMGTSMGGRLALEAALAAPDRIKGLIIIGAGPGAVSDPAAGLRRSARLRGREFEQVIDEMAATISHQPGPNGPATQQTFKDMCFTMGPEPMARQSDALAHRIDRWPQLPHIKCPTLLLWGRQDQFSPLADAERMNSAMPSSTLKVIEACGHFPTLEYPELATRLIVEWMKGFSAERISPS